MCKLKKILKNCAFRYLLTIFPYFLIIIVNYSKIIITLLLSCVEDLCSTMLEGFLVLGSFNLSSLSVVPCDPILLDLLRVLPLYFVICWLIYLEDHMYSNFNSNLIRLHLYSDFVKLLISSWLNYLAVHMNFNSDLFILWMNTFTFHMYFDFINFMNCMYFDVKSINLMNSIRDSLKLEFKQIVEMNLYL
jgi:hypothetical protein